MRGRDRLWIFAAALLVALAVLGVLQYRWLREVADAQRSRMRADAAARAAAIGGDFDREITRAFLMLPLDAATVSSREAINYAARYDEFRRASRWPDLVAGVFAVEGDALLQFSPADRRLVPVAWPDALQPVREKLEREPAARVMPAIVADAPALVVPVAEPMAGLPPAPASPAALGHYFIRRTRSPSSAGCTVLLLDRAVLTKQAIPEILSRRLSTEGAEEYDASIVDGRSGAPIYGSAAPGGGDASVELFHLRLEDLDTAILKSFVPEPLRRDVGDRVTLRVVESVSAGAGQPPSRWRLVLRHKRGSVDQAVQAALARNLAIGFSVLGLLGVSVALIAASAQRERALAARQLEFVAAVSHELRTPLAVIRSAGENLADGVVADSAQVRRYGGLVRDEGLRLTQMVEQVLSFAGADAPGRERAPVDVATVVERAVASEAREGWTIERNAPAGLPPVLGDAAALERAVANLVSNARKYGGPERVIGVRVRGVPEAAPGEITVTVTDRGPGIEADERARLFEPFFRGRQAREAQIPGSGLGLAVVRRIVESHGGRVELVAGPGRGSAFTIVLPAAPASAPRAASDVEAHPAR